MRLYRTSIRCRYQEKMSSGSIWQKAIIHNTVETIILIQRGTSTWAPQSASLVVYDVCAHRRDFAHQAAQKWALLHRAGFLLMYH
jgi:hypothetical protein